MLPRHWWPDVGVWAAQAGMVDVLLEQLRDGMINLENAKDSPRKQGVIARFEKTLASTQEFREWLAGVPVMLGVVADLVEKLPKELVECVRTRLDAGQFGELADYLAIVMVSFRPALALTRMGLGDQPLVIDHAVGPAANRRTPHLLLTAGNNNSKGRYGIRPVLFGPLHRVVEALGLEPGEELERMLATLNDVERLVYEIVKRHLGGAAILSSGTKINQTINRVRGSVQVRIRARRGSQAGPTGTARRHGVALMGHDEGCTLAQKNAPSQRQTKQSVCMDPEGIPAHENEVYELFHVASKSHPWLEHLSGESAEETVANFELAVLHLGADSQVAEVLRAIHVTEAGLDTMYTGFLTQARGDAALLTNLGLPPDAPRGEVCALVAYVRLLFYAAALHAAATSPADDMSALTAMVRAPTPLPHSGTLLRGCPLAAAAQLGRGARAEQLPRRLGVVVLRGPSLAARGVFQLQRVCFDGSAPPHDGASATPPPGAGAATTY